jgi:AcrR family transcriptional regulator
VTLTLVADKLDCSAQMLRRYFPKLCQALIARRRDKYDTEKLRTRLEEVLQGDESPTTSEVARQLRVSTQFLHSACPDLERKIAARRRAYRRQLSESRRAALLQDICRAMEGIATEGRFPSLYQVGR